MAWTSGVAFLEARYSLRFYLAWDWFPGVEVIGVFSITQGGEELAYGDMGVQINEPETGKTRYLITVTNKSDHRVMFEFKGNNVA